CPGSRRHGPGWRSPTRSRPGDRIVTGTRPVGQTGGMKVPALLRRRASRAAPSTTATPQPPESRPLRPVARRPPSRGPSTRVRRMPVGHLRLDENGDGAPRWMRKAAGMSWRLLVILAVVVVLVYATARI